jgi:hypothetical protein
MQNKIEIGLPEASVSSPLDIQIVIPHRSPKQTRAALKYASSFAEGLDVKLRLIDVHVVPYGFPLDAPTVHPRYLTRRLRSLAHESTVPVSAEVVYARDWEHGLRRLLGPRSVVVIAIEKSWWPSREKRLATRLRRLGHQVIWVNCS